jgi:hypothetical protein
MEEKVRYYILSAVYWVVLIPLINLLTFLAPHNNVST